MKLDLTRAHKISPIVKCPEDDQEMTFSECMRCRCFFPIMAGDMMCMSGVGKFKKEIVIWTEQQAP